MNIYEAQDVGVPLRVAYDQWTQFADFPSFMKKVETVNQESDEKSTWTAKVFWSRRSWETTIREQIADSHILWVSSGAKGYADGIVTFSELAPEPDAHRPDHGVLPAGLLREDREHLAGRRSARAARVQALLPPRHDGHAHQSRRDSRAGAAKSATARSSKTHEEAIEEEQAAAEESATSPRTSTAPRTSTRTTRRTYLRRTTTRSWPATRSSRTPRTPRTPRTSEDEPARGRRGRRRDDVEDEADDEIEDEPEDVDDTDDADDPTTRSPNRPRAAAVRGGASGPRPDATDLTPGPDHGRVRRESSPRGGEAA